MFDKILQNIMNSCAILQLSNITVYYMDIDISKNHIHIVRKGKICKYTLNISEDSELLFDEDINFYRVGAYRPSF